MSQRPIRAVVVEDNPNLNADLVFFLESAGIKAVGVNDGQALDVLFAAEAFDVVVLDLGLPGEDGLSIARRLAVKPDLGLVILTARDQLQDRLAGWESGAHVYLTKPIPLAEVAAVVGAVYRRIHPQQVPKTQLWQFMALRRDLIAPSGAVIPLTHRESLLIQAFAAAPQGHIPRDLDLDQDVGTSFDALIHRLRRKLKEHGDPIRTIYGAGYVFDGQLSIEPPDTEAV